MGTAPIWTEYDMARPALKIGQNSIATSKAHDKGRTPGKRGHTWVLQWYANIDGTAKRYSTEVQNATRQQVYDRAYQRFERLMEEAKLPGQGGWTSSSKMGEFVSKVCVPEVDANQYARPLRPNTQARYLHCLRLYARQANGLRIADAAIPSTLEKHFKAIATTNGNPTAKQAAKVVSKYVMDVLVNRRIIDHNPMRPRTFEVTVAEESNTVKKPQGGQALLPEERRRVVDYLLGLDPTTKPRRGKYTQEQVTAKRKAIIDLTLLQATCGLRIGEIRSLERRDINEDGGRMTVTVRAEASKTHRGRTVPILDGRVVERLKERLDGLSGAPGTLVFASPVSGEPWDRANVQKAVRELYDELSEALDLPLLHEVSSHVWRATLNSEWADLGVSAERRAAYFGHSPEVNRTAYTDLVDLSELERQVGSKSVS